MFTTTLTQMAVLALYILIGFTVAKVGVVGRDASGVLSRLENTVFIPALVAGTFMKNFTTATFSSAWRLLLFSLALELLVIPLAILCSRLASRSAYIRSIYTYGLAFSNFGFMGIPVVSALFPEYEMYYIIFTLPLWTLIYVWAVPSLLLGDSDKRKTVGDKLKNLVNPMFIALLFGAAIGLSGLRMPSFVTTVIDACGACMSPIAMIVTGITFAHIKIRRVLSDLGIYIVSLLRLAVFPLLFSGLFLLVTRLFSWTPPAYYLVCLVCSLAMPLGLNTVVVPAALGKDTSVAAGMALISHALSVISIPLVLMLFIS